MSSLSLYLDRLLFDQIYDNKEIEAKIRRKDMKNLFLLCPKNVHFTFGNNNYQQNDGVVMGSPIDPMLSRNFMTHLERALMLELKQYETLEKN